MNIMQWILCGWLLVLTMGVIYGYIWLKKAIKAERRERDKLDDNIARILRHHGLVNPSFLSHLSSRHQFMIQQSNWWIYVVIKLADYVGVKLKVEVEKEKLCIVPKKKKSKKRLPWKKDDAELAVSEGVTNFDVF